MRGSLTALLLFAPLLWSCGAKTGLNDHPCGAPCDDGLHCNGVETCDGASRACVPGTPPSCDDGVECTVDSCDEAADACAHVSVERDEDGDGVGACAGDCDDRDPARTPGRAEVCDMRDQDCDGAVDEGLVSECGDCRAGCHVLVVPGTGESWEDTRESSGVEERGGRLELARTMVETSFAYIANMDSGTLTKLDTRDGAQVAEYDSVWVTGDNHPEPPGAGCDRFERVGNCPSRTAVDLDGAVYVANRAFEGQGTVSKIAGREEDCVDRNGDGRIDTSRDVDGNGLIDRDGGEFLGQEDECLLWTVDVGGINGVPRALAIDREGDVWVGLHEEHRVLELAPDDGRVLREVRLPGDFRPYGAAIGRDGRMWLADSITDFLEAGYITWVDTGSGEAGPRIRVNGTSGCSGAYGIAVDGEGRVWTAGFTCAAALRYDPSTAEWTTIRLPDSDLLRGIALDDRGWVYLTASHSTVTLAPGDISRVTRFRAEDGSDMEVFETLGAGSIGVGLDDERRVWLINEGSETATMLDPETGEQREFPVGARPYTYSDFTGFALRNFTVPDGYAREVRSGCRVGPTVWERVSYDGAVPPRTSLEVSLRAAPSEAELALAPWQGPFADGADLGAPPGPLPDGSWLEVEARLRSEARTVSPSVREIRVQYFCPAE